MTSWLEFTVPGNPKAKGRPRFSGHAYTPKATLVAEEEIWWVAKEAMGTRKPVTASLVVGIDFRMATARRVDIDNLAKLVLDALNEVVWVDDAQIVTLVLTKSIDRVSPRTDVRVALEEAA